MPAYEIQEVSENLSEEVVAARFAELSEQLHDIDPEIKNELESDPWGFKPEGGNDDDSQMTRA